MTRLFKQKPNVLRRYQRSYRAESGESGRGRNCTGRSGVDLVLKVPVGTTILDEDTGAVGRSQISSIDSIASGRSILAMS